MNNGVLNNTFLIKPNPAGPRENLTYIIIFKIIINYNLTKPNLT